MEGTSGRVERISTACPSFSCTILKLLMTATLLAEVLLAAELLAAEAVFAPGPEDGTVGEAADVWECSGVVHASTPRARAAYQFAGTLQPFRGCGNRRCCGKSFTCGARVLLQTYHSKVARRKMRNQPTREDTRITRRPGSHIRQSRRPPPTG